MAVICDPNPFPAREALPLGSLLILALCSFVTLMTEVMPAGLLPGIGRSLGVPESGAGQLVTAYALGSSITAIPLMAFSQAMRRRRLLLTAISGFAVVNMVTAVSGFYWLTLGTRFLAGMFGGIVWALMVGYAVRISPPRLAGRAIAISGGGAPLAWSVGVPAGTFLGTLSDWRVPFCLMSLLALVLIPSILAKLPDLWRRRDKHGAPLRFGDATSGHRLELALVDAETETSARPVAMRIETGSGADALMAWCVARGADERIRRR